MCQQQSNIPLMTKEEPSKAACIMGADKTWHQAKLTLTFIIVFKVIIMKELGGLFKNFGNEPQNCWAILSLC